MDGDKVPSISPIDLHAASGSGAAPAVIDGWCDQPAEGEPMPAGAWRAPLNVSQWRAGLSDVHTDRTFSSPGKIVLWTKADSVTRFDWIDIKHLKEK